MTIGDDGQLLQPPFLMGQRLPFDGGCWIISSVRYTVDGWRFVLDANLNEPTGVSVVRPRGPTARGAVGGHPTIGTSYGRPRGLHVDPRDPPFRQ